MPRTINADDITPVCESHGHYAFANTANTVKSFLFRTMADIFDYDTVRIDKSILPHLCSIQNQKAQ